MKIYDYKGFPNPLRVRIALAEKGLLHAVEFVHVDVPAGEHKQPAFLAKNPTATVPVLELDDGTVISECTAITEYIDNHDGEPLLTGRTPKERAIVHMMQRRIEAGLLDAATAYFHHATPGLGPNIETYQNHEWGEHQRMRVVATMRALDGELATRPYMAGEMFTMADITAMAGMRFAGFVKIEMPVECTNLAAWCARVDARPSLAEAA
ncbi:glutathione S-transferase family protein [Acidocella facilis]|jgi:glutathione S-transferase|uniref:glutathione S-transferase family protein n=1 Tax=Acidocella facilis TaxID=525 RepID=UPI001F18D3C3|nr:glutathione S-transferase [Acidocella facilis]